MEIARGRTSFKIFMVELMALMDASLVLMTVGPLRDSLAPQKDSGFSVPV